MLRSITRGLLALFLPLALQASEPLVALVNPSLSLRTLTREGAAAILRGDTVFLDGKRLVVILTKPSSASLPAVTFGLLKENPQAYFMRIKAAKLRGVNLDPQFQDTPEAAMAAVTANPAAIAFLAAKDTKPVGVRIISIPD